MKYATVNGVKYKRRRQYFCNNDLFRENTERGMYWLGFCSADGHVAKNKFEVQVDLAKADRERLEEFKKALETDKPIYDQWNKKFPSSKLYVTSEHLATDLRNFGPESILNCSEAVQHHLIIGIFDGDGSVVSKNYIYNKVIHYDRRIRICGEQNVLAAIQEVIIKKGMTKGFIRKAQGIYEWSLSGANNLKEFYLYIYENSSILLERKKKAFNLYLDSSRKVYTRRKLQELRL